MRVQPVLPLLLFKLVHVGRPALKATQYDRLAIVRFSTQSSQQAHGVSSSLSRIDVSTTSYRCHVPAGIGLTWLGQLLRSAITLYTEGRAKH